MAKEGRRIKGITPMDQVAYFIMPNRTGCSNLFRMPVDITACEAYIKGKRNAGKKGFGMLHVVLAAYTRMLSQRPGINRFIRGQRVYARNGIFYSMTIKKEMRLNAPETVVKLAAQPEDTADVIYEKLSALVAENKGESEENGMDKVAGALTHLPRPLLKFAVWLLKLLDYFGLLPNSLLQVSPFHGSMYITNVASLGIPAVYHHLYDFGNVPVFISIGRRYSKPVLQPDGSVIERRYMDLILNSDERICDGYYYASGIKMMERLFQHPETLDAPPKTVVPDIE